MRWRRQRAFSINRGIRRFFGGRVQQRMISWTPCLLHQLLVALGGIGRQGGPDWSEGPGQSLCVLSRDGFRGSHSSVGSYRNWRHYRGRYVVDAEIFYERDKEGGGSRWVMGKQSDYPNGGSPLLAMARSFLFPFAGATYPYWLSIA